MKFVTVIGARPQFIKAAALSDVLRVTDQEIMVHTGQHYDANMSDAFFTELKIPAPDYFLGIGSGLHGYQTGHMIIQLEEILIKEKPDCVIVYGDTNSTLAGAVTAGKLLLPVIHIEAGLRSRDRTMPEEQNRILTDHLSTYLFTPTEAASQNLRMEGICDGVHMIGDIMCDAFQKYLALSDGVSIPEMEAYPDYVLATIHRVVNTDDPVRLGSIVDALNEYGKPVLLPLHPRTRKCIQAYGLKLSDNIHTLPPVGYLEMLKLESNAHVILTDSGGVQKEAYFAGKPCITMRDETEWTETIECGWNVLVGADKKKILEALNGFSPKSPLLPLYGDGHAAEKICDILHK